MNRGPESDPKTASSSQTRSALALSDPELLRMEWSLDDYAEAAALFCKCEALCTCGWNRPGSPAMVYLSQKHAKGKESGHG